MTEYEIRISDWSSDVCSSDLKAEPGFPVEAEAAGEFTPCQLEVGQRGVSGPGNAASHQIWRHQQLAGHRREDLFIARIAKSRRQLQIGIDIVIGLTERGVGVEGVGIGTAEIIVPVALDGLDRIGVDIDAQRSANRRQRRSEEQRVGKEGGSTGK